MKINLTPDQQNASDKFLEFLFDPEKKYLAIEGIAGTGKTFLLNHLRTVMYEAYRDTCKLVGIEPRNTPNLTATTNKACGVLSSSIKGIQIETIYSYIGLTVSTNFNTGKTYIKAKTGRYSPSSIHYNKGKDTILFIDEASMISADLLRNIEAYLPLAKIVFIGDPSQLLMVGSTKPAYKQLDMEIVSLETQVRNKGNPHLSNLYLQFHNTVNTQQYWDTVVVEGTIDHITDPTELSNELSKLFTLSTDLNHQVLSYTNDQTLEYTKAIRSLNNRSEDSWDIGETVISNDICFGSYDSSYTSSERESIIGETHFEIVSKIRDCINLADLITDPKLALDVLSDPDKLNLIVEINRYLVKEVGTNRSLFITELVDRKATKPLLDFLVSQGSWHSYFYIKESFASLRLSDVSTIHKSQGSTYHTVIIDLNNIGMYCKNADTLARLMYVAVSRATDRVILYGNLPSQFGDILK